MDSRLISSYWALRIAFGATAFLAGLDKFFNLLADWERYVSPLATQFVSAPVLMRAVGVIEMAVGLTILLGATRLGALVASAWLIAIALNLVTTGHFDIAVRDVVLAIAAFSLARLAEIRAESQAAVPSRVAVTA